MLLLLLLPHRATGSFTGNGAWSGVGTAASERAAEHSRPLSAEASHPAIAEDYRRWAGTVASAMLLRGGNNQAAGERELASLQAITYKMLDNWEAGILPPQVEPVSAPLEM